MVVKVFGIGLAKTGSISLQKAWDILKYRTLHYPVSWSEIDRHDAVNGTSVACRFEEVDRRYPGSKFILTVQRARFMVAILLLSLLRTI